MNMNRKLDVALATERSTAIGYLRAFITVLVVAHHAVLAYHPYAPEPPASLGDGSMIWAAFPVVDIQRWPGIDLLVGFNDIFFMALMFFISGLFVWPSLVRKGAGGFVRDRIVRLGVPFLISAALLAPLAYYPTYLATGADPSLAAYAKTWLGLSYWPSGPAWFVWVLLAFGTLAAGLAKLAPRWGETLGTLTAFAGRRPFAFFLALLAVSALAYVPMAYAFSAEAWSTFGPFCVQASRVLVYAVYFFAGAAVGAHGVERGLLAPQGNLARRPVRWSLAAFGAFIWAVAVFIVLLTTLPKGGPSTGLLLLSHFDWTLSCAASCFAFLCLFVRFANQPKPWFESLSRNAYGMFLTHYVFVTWLQFALLGYDLPGAIKGSLVFVGAVALSWYATALMRRIPAVARVIG